MVQNKQHLTRYHPEVEDGCEIFIHTLYKYFIYLYIG